MIRIFILIFLSLTSFAQKSEVVFKSTVNHNYAIGNDYYVEDAIDTTRLLFMGIIKISCLNQDEIIAGAQQILKTKAKELNGNCYKVKNFILQESSISILFDVYFAPEKQIDLIKANSIIEKVIIYNNTKDTAIRPLIININTYCFSNNKRLEIFCPNKVVIIKLDTSSAHTGGITELVPKKKKAIFFTIKLKDNLAPVIVGSILGGAVGAVIAGAVVQKRKNKVENEFLSRLNYNTGRILMEIYPLDKQITLD